MRLYRCPDCDAEGGGRQPASAFYWTLYRSTYCRRHHDARAAARQAERLDPASPEYDATFHEARKASSRRYHRRKLDPSSPDYDPALHARQLAAKMRSYEKRRKKQRE